jgi:hypothetical protein
MEFGVYTASTSSFFQFQWLSRPSPKSVAAALTCA